MREGVTMFQHLAGAISSLISLDAESAANRKSAPWPMVRNRDTGEQPADFASADPTPEDALAAREAEVRQQRLLARIQAVLSDDPMLLVFARAVMDADAPPSPADLASRFGWTPVEVYNMRKRLQRRLGPLLRDEQG
jgi:hypothetical protein